MWRFLAGVGSALLLMAAGMTIWRSRADAVGATQATDMFASPSADIATPLGFADIAAPIEAGEKTREQKRFSRYDQDENHAISQGEYLASRRKAYARIDLNGDGRLSFEEYAAKAVIKFAKADRDKSGVLTAAEFLTTRVVRKTVGTKCPRPNAVQVRAPAAPAEGEGEDG